MRKKREEILSSFKRGDLDNPITFRSIQEALEGIDNYEPRKYFKYIFKSTYYPFIKN